MNSLVIRSDTRQQHGLSPRLQHAVRLLQMSSIEFAGELHHALDTNPFLEGDEAEADPALPGAATPADEMAITDEPLESLAAEGGDADADGRDAAMSAGNAADGDADGDGDGDGFERLDEGNPAERDAWQADGVTSARRGEDGALGSMDTMAFETSLSGYLHGQLNTLPLPQRDLLLAKAIVESLDDDGYLRLELPELVAITALDPPADLDELHIALKRVQSLDPIGIAARSVAECLHLQLPLIECPQQQALARLIVDEHLSALAAKDVPGLARRLGKDVAEVEAACQRIRRLDPRPGWRFSSTQVQYITPDVVVRRFRNTWTALLNPAVLPKVRLNQVYAEMFQRHRSARNGELAAHLQEARWTLRNIEQRFSTILGVAQAIVKRQHLFFDHGPLAMKPLGLREIADELGIHESTVSRVTNNKYMSTPIGVFELKYFFSRAMTTASGGACSATAIRGVIRDMIDAESSKKPLSDAEIARQLSRQGLVIARRTVTKYRQAMRIEAVERRREHTMAVA